MKYTGKYCAQGDLNVFAVDEIPKNLTMLEATNGQHILAHSETGHHHVIDGNAVRVYRENEFVSYLDVQKESKVVHLRSYDTHEPLMLSPGGYRVTQQREYTAEGFRRAAD